MDYIDRNEMKKIIYFLEFSLKTTNNLFLRWYFLELKSKFEKVEECFTIFGFKIINHSNKSIIKHKRQFNLRSRNEKPKKKQKTKQIKIKDFCIK